MKKIIFLTILSIATSVQAEQFRAQSLFELLYIIDTAYVQHNAYYQEMITNDEATRMAKDLYRIDNNRLEITENGHILLPNSNNFKTIMPDIWNAVQRTQGINVQQSKSKLLITTSQDNCEIEYQIRQNLEGNLELENNSSYFGCSDFPTEERWLELYELTPAPYY